MFDYFEHWSSMVDMLRIIFADILNLGQDTTRVNISHKRKL